VTLEQFLILHSLLWGRERIMGSYWDCPARNTASQDQVDRKSSVWHATHVSCDVAGI